MNVANVVPRAADPTLHANLAQNQQLYSASSSSSQNYRGGQNGSGKGRDGRSSIQCQLCRKYDHDAFVCWHRFDQQFVHQQPQQQNPNHFYQQPHPNPPPWQQQPQFP